MSKCIVFLLVLTYWRNCNGMYFTTKRAHDGEFPWLIQFQTVVPCGGVLVSPDWVLTAAQCVQDKRNSIVLYATGLNGTGSTQAINVKATYIFPQYQAYSTTRDHDYNVALLKLVHAFDICDDRITLLDVAPLKLDDIYKTCVIFGWQSYVSPTSKVSAKPIQYSEVVLNTWKLCTYKMKAHINFTNVFCTMIESESGMEACAGNPGSPVICEDQFRRTLIVGIASWTNFALDCGGFPTYVGVSVFRDWMYNLIVRDKNVELWDSRKNNVGNSNSDQHLEEIVIRNDNLNYSEHLEKSQLIEPSESKRLVQKIKDNTTLSNKYYHLSFLHAAKDQNENLRQYQEIGKSMNLNDRIIENVKSLEKNNILDSVQHPLTSKNIYSNQSLKIAHNEKKLTDLYDLDLLLPFNFDELSKSCSAVNIKVKFTTFQIILGYLFYKLYIY